MLLHADEETGPVAETWCETVMGREIVIAAIADDCDAFERRVGLVL
jgi:hypothetical protein